MIDGKIRPFIDPPLNAVGAVLARIGVKADHLSYAAMALGALCGLAIAFDHHLAALVLILLNRLCDGLDGAVARARRSGGPSAYGGFLDVAADFVFFASVPLGFAFTDPANALPAAVLLAAILLTGANFLAFAAAAKDLGLQSRAQGEKSLYYMNGLIEGAETIAFFVLFVLTPSIFPLSASIFAGLCFTTAVQRLLIARKFLKTP